MDTSVYLDNSKEATSLYAQLREAQAEVAWLRAALTDAVMTVGQSRKSHLGDHYSYCPQISEQRLEKWRGVLAKPHSVSPSVTNRENDKQPQCGHPRAAISGGECTLHCRWCEDVAAARAEGAAAQRDRRWPIYDDKLIQIQKVVNPILRTELGDDWAVSISQIRHILKTAAAIRSAEEAQE